MNNTVIEFLGWIPAIILPAATLSQLIKIIKDKSGKGVSILAWLLFAIANISLYIYTEKYLSFQSLIGLLGTAILDIVIIIFTLKYRNQ